MVAIQALVFFMNIMFGPGPITPEEYKMLQTTPEYQQAVTADPMATQAIVIVDQNEM
jgi:hypothetical protein